MPHTNFGFDVGGLVQSGRTLGVFLCLRRLYAAEAIMLSLILTAVESITLEVCMEMGVPTGMGIGFECRVNYKLGVLTHRCLLGKAPVYLSNCCIPVSQVASRQHLRSAARHQLTVPRHRLSTYGRRAFAVAGPTMFNTLPDDLRDPALSTSTFKQSLKTHLFSAYQHV